MLFVDALRWKENQMSVCLFVCLWSWQISLLDICESLRLSTNLVLGLGHLVICHKNLLISLEAQWYWYQDARPQITCTVTDLACWLDRRLLNPLFLDFWKKCSWFLWGPYLRTHTTKWLSYTLLYKMASKTSKISRLWSDWFFQLLNFFKDHNIGEPVRRKKEVGQGWDFSLACRLKRQGLDAKWRSPEKFHCF